MAEQHDRRVWQTQPLIAFGLIELYTVRGLRRSVAIPIKRAKLFMGQHSHIAKAYGFNRYKWLCFRQS